MTTTTATHMTTVPCPRCHGFENAFTRFGHIAHGKCLRCLGARTVEVPTWKLNEQRAANAATKAKAAAEMMARPYIVAFDGMESISHTHATFEAARADVIEHDGWKGARVAKFDGEFYRYRDGARVRFHHESN